MSSRQDEVEQISMIKGHLKQLAEYYQQSFFDKNNLEGEPIEEIVKLMAEQIQHDEQCILSVLDLVGMLILKCEIFFQLQEENDIQQEEQLHRFQQMLDIEKQSVAQYQSLYKEQQIKNHELLDRLTQTENKIHEEQQGRISLQIENSRLEKAFETAESQTLFIDQMKKEYESLNSQLAQKNLDLSAQIQIFEQALLNFGEAHEDLTEQIAKLTDELNHEKQQNRILTKKNETLTTEIENSEAQFQQRIQTLQQQAMAALKRPSFLNTPRAMNNRMPRPSLLPINAYSQMLQKDINKTPFSLKMELVSVGEDETNTNLSFSDLTARKRTTILPHILAQQLLSMNPSVFNHNISHISKSQISKSQLGITENSDGESEVSSITPRSSIQPQQQNLHEEKKTFSAFVPDHKSHFALANQKSLDIRSRTQSQVSNFFEDSKGTEIQVQKHPLALKVTPRNNANKGSFSEFTSQRRDPYHEFFILTCQCVKLNSRLFHKIYKYDTQKLYTKVVKSRIPYNKWYDYVKREVENS